MTFKDYRQGIILSVCVLRAGDTNMITSFRRQNLSWALKGGKDG